MTSSSIHYAFLRGAGKQYGVHWFGNAAVFNTWHYKDYVAQAANSGPTKGNSLNLLRRLLFSHYLYNSVILGFEAALYETSWWPPDGAGPLSPLGLIQQDAVKFVADHPQPGVMHAPVALLLDHFAGWMPARTWTTAYRVWGYLPYDPGDYLTHGALSMLYPGYEDCAWYLDERGTICNTSYGYLADVASDTDRASSVTTWPGTSALRHWRGGWPTPSPHRSSRAAARASSLRERFREFAVSQSCRGSARSRPRADSRIAAGSLSKRSRKRP